MSEGTMLKNSMDLPALTLSYCRLKSPRGLKGTVWPFVKLQALPPQLFTERQRWNEVPQGKGLRLLELHLGTPAHVGTDLLQRAPTNSEKLWSPNQAQLTSRLLVDSAILVKSLYLCERLHFHIGLVRTEKPTLLGHCRVQ